MAEVVLIVMLIAATLYAVLGGADFGVGLIEPFIEPDERARIDVAIAPVWEANHVWLVLLATLAFVGFPPVYAAVTGYLHIPILLILLGIVARGSAFTFRHYDPGPSALAPWYTGMFRFGSFLTPLFLGITLAATAHGTLETDLSRGFYAVYVAPWNTAFGWATGAFVCALFAFEGAALLAAEHANDATTLPYRRIARNAHILAIVLGAAVLALAYRARLPWLARTWDTPLSIAALALATALVPLVAHAFHRGRPWLLRLATGAQVASVLLGFFVGQLPTLVRTQSGDLTIANAQAPASTFRSLLWAVVIGLCAIVPGVVYLIHVYKQRGPADDSVH